MRRAGLLPPPPALTWQDSRDDLEGNPVPAHQAAPPTRPHRPQPARSTARPLGALTQLVNDAVAALALADGVLRQLQRHHGDGQDLAGRGQEAEVEVEGRWWRREGEGRWWRRGGGGL